MELRDKYLWDIYNSVEKIDAYTQDRGRRFDVFQQDPLFQDAVLWNLLVIGEAMKGVLKADSQIPITNARKFANCRNYIAHAYDSFTPGLIWGFVIKDLPKLKKEVKTLLKDIPFLNPDEIQKVDDPDPEGTGLTK